MEYWELEKEEFFIPARECVVTMQQAFHRHLETFLIIQFYSHLVTEHQTYTRELQSYSVFHVHSALMECALSIQLSLYPGEVQAQRIHKD